LAATSISAVKFCSDGSLFTLLDKGFGKLSDVQRSQERKTLGGHSGGNPGNSQLADQSLDGWDFDGRDTEIAESESEPDWEGFRIRGNLPTDRRFNIVFPGGADHLLANSENRWMKRIGEGR
jgi:hypothetical protein